jgi:hypothetical protein
MLPHLSLPARGRLSGSGVSAAMSLVAKEETEGYCRLKTAHLRTSPASTARWALWSSTCKPDGESQSPDQLVIRTAADWRNRTRFEPARRRLYCHYSCSTWHFALVARLASASMSLNLPKRDSKQWLPKSSRTPLPYPSQSLRALD